MSTAPVAVTVGGCDAAGARHPASRCRRRRVPARARARTRHGVAGRGGWGAGRSFFTRLLLLGRSAPIAPLPKGPGAWSRGGLGRPGPLLLQLVAGLRFPLGAGVSQGEGCGERGSVRVRISMPDGAGRAGGVWPLDISRAGRRPASSPPQGCGGGVLLRIQKSASLNVPCAPPSSARRLPASRAATPHATHGPRVTASLSMGPRLSGRGGRRMASPTDAFAEPPDLIGRGGRDGAATLWSREGGAWPHRPDAFAEPPDLMVAVVAMRLCQNSRASPPGRRIAWHRPASMPTAARSPPTAFAAVGHGDRVAALRSRHRDRVAAPLKLRRSPRPRRGPIEAPAITVIASRPH